MLVRVADRFPARPYLISALNLARLQVGASGSDRVIVIRQVGADVVVELDQGEVVLRAVSLAALPPSWVTAD